MKPAWEKAVRAGDAAGLCQLLAEAGAQAGELVDSRDQHGQTGLMLAATHGYEEVGELLIAQGAALNHTAKYGLSALMLAVINNHAGIVRSLIAAGADRTLRGSGAPGFHQKTALDLARDAGRVEMIEVLSK